MFRLRLMLALLGAAGLGAALYFSWPERTKAARPVPGPVPVMAAKAEAKDVPIILRGLGIVTAFNTVAVTSRVEGAITKINFKEGQYVRTGDLLIQLDPRPFQAALDQASANLAKDQATLANAKVDLSRYSSLLTHSFAPEQQVATQKTTVQQTEAAVQSDEAAIKAAQLNVDYAALRSPIDGVTGIRHVDIGNLIQANNQQNLVTITQIEPIYVIFTLPEVDIDRVRQAMKEGSLKVEAYASDDKRKLSEGVLDLIDNAVDPTTGTVKLKAEFENADQTLWPGQFVNAHAVLRTVKDGVTIPAAAVQTGPNGAFTYKIDDESKAVMQPITVVQTEENLALVSGALKAGDQVITIGQFRLQPGVKVRVEDHILDAGQTLSDAPVGTDGVQ
ncbi:efflux transporter, RND family, MFP subunit [Methylocella silvestris BL2]|uniref:Efflux transporter, RND family, MFP subunit n=2 Tax=Methylocella silvestris TaxID=199596 RepID=B8ES81_METSB|nr:efflux transporter, RND family, MFP subunit [Methylocella silvestris BL2]